MREVLFTALLICLSGAFAGAVAESPEAPGPAAEERSERRLFDGAPPVIPHEAFGGCADCHYREGEEVPDLGVAPASPHVNLEMRCEQCHVYRTTDALFIGNAFVGVRWSLAPSERLPGGPPVIPHRTLLQGNCAGCHSGETARAEIRTSHPERPRCRQCHVELVTRAEFGG